MGDLVSLMDDLGSSNYSSSDLRCCYSNPFVHILWIFFCLSAYYLVTLTKMQGYILSASMHDSLKHFLYKILGTYPGPMQSCPRRVSRRYKGLTTL